MGKSEFSYEKEVMTDEMISLINHIANMGRDANHIIKFNTTAGTAGTVDIDDMVNCAAWICHSQHHSYIVYVDILNKAILKQQFLESSDKDVVNEHAETELKKLIEEKFFNIGTDYIGKDF